MSPVRHDLDQLRAWAMLAGVAFHAALAYSPMLRPYWPAADTSGAAWVDALAWWMHLFRMPLFFALAGYFCALKVKRDGLSQMLSERLRRVLLPLLILLLPLNWAMHRLTIRAAQHVDNPSAVLVWIGQRIDEQGSVPMLPGLGHLWFLAYLWLFVLLVWVLRTLELGALLARIGTRLRSRWSLIGVPVLMTPPLALTHAPWPAPESILPQAWAVAYFGLFFALGFQLQRDEELVARWQRDLPWLLIGSLLAYSGMPWMLGSPDHGSWLHAVLQACAGYWMVLVCIAAARRWLTRPSAIARWLAESAYWVYLVHLPMLFAIQYWLLDVAIDWRVKLVLATALTLLGALLSFAMLVRRTALGRWLGGRRSNQSFASSSGIRRT
jgi:peptidoglycan/LPS O-acetylase OafA/YrhL